MDVAGAGQGEELVGECGRKKRRHAIGEKEGGVRAVDACGQEAMKEACVHNIIRLHA